MKRILLLALFFCFAANVYAQDRLIKGTVFDEGTKKPLAGVSVKIKETKKSTLTDGNGNYSIPVSSSNNTIEFSYLGFETTSLKVADKETINVSLNSKQEQLSEVVITAYGVSKKKDFTGSAGQLEAKDFAKRPVTNVVNALEGSIAGVTLAGATGQPGSTPTIRVRGFGSINSSNDPLIVVDGAPYPFDMSNLNQDDIESLTVLKDASSTALYGSRAANGVVMITTKKGKKGNSTINVKYASGLTTRGIVNYETVDAYQYYPLVFEALKNGPIFAGTKTKEQITSELIGVGSGSAYGFLGYNNPFNVANDKILSVDGVLNPDAKLLYEDDLDWWSHLLRTGMRNELTASIMGGSENSDHVFSVGYLNEDGSLINTGFKRYNARLSLNTKHNSYFKTGLNAAYTFSDYKSNSSADDAGSGIANPFFTVVGLAPIYPVYLHMQGTENKFYLDPITEQKVYDNGGGYKDATGAQVQQRVNGVGRHIVQETLLNNRIQNRHLFSGRTYAQFDFLKDFNLRTNLGYDYGSRVNNGYGNTIIGDSAPSGSQSKALTNNMIITFNQILNYSKTLYDKHNISALLGHENYYVNDEYFSGNKTGLTGPGIEELDNFTTIGGMTGYKDNYRLESFFGEVKYNFDRKYYVSATFRRDGSSKFAPDVRWGNFWSVGGAWIVSEESFMKNINWVNELKLRSSYGETGNDGSNLYAWQKLYDIKPNGANGSYFQSRLPNADLKWEVNKTMDIALEFGVLKNRLRGSLELYNRGSENLIFDVPLPLSGGNSSITKNLGSMYNKGFEFDITGTLIKQKDFTWDLNLNGTMFKNEITKMPDEQKVLIDGTKRYAEGVSRYEFWLRQWVGVDPQTGASLYIDDASTDGNTMYTTDVNKARYAYSGNSIPDISGGIKNTFTYKGISLSVLANYSLGGKIYDGLYAGLMGNGSAQGGAFHTDILNRWQKPGDITNVPRLDYSDRTNLGAASSNRWLIDNNYFVLRNITLNYDLPKSITSKLKLNKLNVFAAADNLMFFTPRKGLNSTISFNGTTSNSYIPSRVFSFGLNLNF